jgi:tetratricopeptide (TPR) repeat protein
MILETQGDYRNAFSNYEQAENWSKQKSNNDSFTIQMMHKKALLYDKQGYYDRAIGAYKQARHQSIQIYSEEDLSTLEIQNNYAITRRKQGYYDKALEIFQRICRIHGHVQGRNHPLTLNMQGNIEIINGIRGQPDALHAHEWVLELKKKWLGSESASTLSTLSAYALLLSKLKHHQVAMRVAQQALEGYQKVLGESDPATLGVIANCALIYEEMGDMENAKQYYHHARMGQTKLLGLENPSTLKTLADFSSMLVRLRSYEEAAALQNQVRRGYARIYGPTHLFTKRAEHERRETARLAQQGEAGASFAGTDRTPIEAPSQESTREEQLSMKRSTWMAIFGKGKK